MQWDNLPDKEKVRTILIEVLGCRCFEDYKAYLAELRKTREDEGENVDDRGPYAFYDEHCSQGPQWFVSWSKGDYPLVFDPVHALDDAWEIVERKLSDHHLTMRRWEDGALFDHAYEFHIDPGTRDAVSGGGVTLNDAVCRAALKYCGIDV
jgi:hypothetical protein